MDFLLNTTQNKDKIGIFISSENIKNTNTDSFTIKLNLVSLIELSFLIEEVLLNNNPIVKNSIRLKSNIRKIIFDKNRTEIIEDILILINRYGSINIEGYINFKLQVYTNAIDDILYFAIKNNIEILKA